MKYSRWWNSIIYFLQTLSPVFRPAAERTSKSFDEVENTPVAPVPSATIIAPVRVATSNTHLNKDNVISKKIAEGNYSKLFTTAHFYGGGGEKIDVLSF